MVAIHPLKAYSKGPRASKKGGCKRDAMETPGFTLQITRVVSGCNYRDKSMYQAVRGPTIVGKREQKGVMLHYVVVSFFLYSQAD